MDANEFHLVSSFLQDQIRLGRIPQMPFKPVWAVIHGSHAFGFAHPTTSDFDVYGVHVTPARDLLGLPPNASGREGSVRDSYSYSSTLLVATPDPDPANLTIHTRRIEFLSRDLSKFLELLLNCNGSILEQAHSLLTTVDERADLDSSDGFWSTTLRELALQTICLRYARYYSNVADRGWRQYTRDLRTATAKDLLHVFQRLLTGCWLIRTGSVETKLPRLVALELGSNAILEDLIARMVESPRSSGASGLPPALHTTGENSVRVSLIDRVQEHVAKLYYYLQSRLQDLCGTNSSSLAADVFWKARQRASQLLIDARLETLKAPESEIKLAVGFDPSNPHALDALRQVVADATQQYAADATPD